MRDPRFNDSNATRDPETDYLMMCTVCTEVGPLESFEWVAQQGFSKLEHYHVGCTGYLFPLIPNDPCEKTKYPAECPYVMYREQYDKLPPEEQAEVCAKIKEYYIEVRAQNKARALAYDAQMEAKKRAQELLDAGKPKCPTCSSTNIRRISMLSRGLSVGFFGLASDKIGKQFQCDNCGYKW